MEIKLTSGQPRRPPQGQILGDNEIGTRKGQIYKRVCVVCGREYSTHCSHGVYCADCKPLATRIRDGIIYRHIRTTPAEFRALVVKAYMGELTEWGGKRTRRYEHCHVGKCKWCGRTCEISGSGFCASCHNAGYDGVYEVTGRAPSREPKRKVQIVPGWRGQRVAGGGMLHFPAN